MIAQAYEDKESTKKHPHADFLAEALKDTSRKIEGKYLEHGDWEGCSLTYVIAAVNAWQFRFADTVKTARVSPLTDEELNKIHKGSYSGGEYRRAIANASNKRAIEDVIKMVKNARMLTDAEIMKVYSNSGRSTMSTSDFCLAYAIRDKAIADFQAQLLKQLGE